MSDLISRQSAIAATMETVFVEYEDGDPRKEESIILQTKAAIRDRIKVLPPVYVPDTNVGDMISRQAAIDAVEKYACNTQRTYEAIKNLPPVQTEIIHCKDCLYKKICSWENQGATFCSFGERGIVDGTD